MVMLFVNALTYPDLSHMMTSWLVWTPGIAWVNLCQHEVQGAILSVPSSYTLARGLFSYAASASGRCTGNTVNEGVRILCCQEDLAEMISSVKGHSFTKTRGGLRFTAFLLVT
jgi:hypothetical protein